MPRCSDCKYFAPNPSNPNQGTCSGILVAANGSCDKFVPKDNNISQNQGGKMIYGQDQPQQPGGVQPQPNVPPPDTTTPAGPPAGPAETPGTGGPAETPGAGAAPGSTPTPGGTPGETPTPTEEPEGEQPAGSTPGTQPPPPPSGV